MSAKKGTAKSLSRREFLKGMAAAGAASVTAASTVGTALASKPNRSITPVLMRQEKRVVEMWMWETEEQWKQVEAASGLNEQFPDVEFRWTSLPYADLHQKAVASLAAGIPEGLPSLFRTHNPFYRPLVNTGSILDVTEQLAPYESDVLGSVWQEGTIDGRHYHVPDDTSVLLMGYRTDIFEAAGLPTDPAEVAELLATYDDYITVGQTIKDATGASITNMTAGSTMFTNFIGQNTTGLFNEEGNVIFDSEAHVEAATMAKKLWDSGLTLDVGLYTPQLFQAFKDGQVATYFYPNFYDFVLLDNAPETTGLWRVTKLPKLNDASKRARVDPGLGLVIPSILPEEQQQLALEVALHLKLTEQGTVAHMKTFPGAFVSYIPGLEAMNDEPSPVLNEQFTFREFLGALADEQPHPRLVSSAFESDAGGAINDAMFLILTENAPIAETLTNAANSIRQLQDSRGIK